MVKEGVGLLRGVWRRGRWIGVSGREAAGVLAMMYRLEPDSIKGLTDAIDKIIKEIQGEHEADQALIKKEIGILHQRTRHAGACSMCEALPRWRAARYRGARTAAIQRANPNAARGHAGAYSSHIRITDRNTITLGTSNLRR